MGGALRNRMTTLGRNLLEASKRFLCSLHTLASDVRRNRELIEKEIHHGQYKLRSKNDDDLPAIR